MRQLQVPVLWLATVVLSATAMLPMMAANQDTDLGIDGQQYDNTFSNKYRFRDTLNHIFYYKIPEGTTLDYELRRKMSKYVKTNNDRAEENMNNLVDENYDREGFRKEQWHNYPRQLDRLHTLLLEMNPERRSRRSDSTEDDLQDNVDSNNNIATNEFFIDNSEGVNEKYNAMEAANPLLILKVHLDCLRNGNKLSGRNEDENLLSSNIIPAIKVKRDGSTSQDVEIIEESIPDGSKIVNKRLFSLWSRLQSLSHKGHELQHRRHHAFYSFPDAEGSGSLTAETRTAMKRPPGSPLRWG